MRLNVDHVGFLGAQGTTGSCCISEAQPCGTNQAKYIPPTLRNDIGIFCLPFQAPKISYGTLGEDPTNW
jgi:hypothetical protein